MREIQLANFRCFGQHQVARVAPLTLLVGENSTGKTSFMAMIRALWDIAYRQTLPDFKESPYDLGSFREIAYHTHNDGKQADTFYAGFSSSFVDNRSAQSEGVSYVPFKFDVSFGQRGTVPIPVRRRLDFDDCWMEELYNSDSSVVIRLGVSDASWQAQIPQELGVNPIDLDSYRIRPLFYTLLTIDLLLNDDSMSSMFEPIGGSRDITDVDLEELQSRVQLELHSDFVRRMDMRGRRPFASAPVRSRPSRTYDPARPTPDPEGNYIPSYLASIFFENKNNWSRLKSKLETFGKDSGLFDEIDIRPLGRLEAVPFQVHVRKHHSGFEGLQRNLIDVGYGVSQILPIATELLRNDLAPISLLQQPEVHLHPSAQAALGTLLCQVASEDNQLIVETHSDHLLDRVRMDIRDKRTRLTPEDISILFFESRALDVRIHSLKLDSSGNIVGAPPSYREFFLTEIERSLGL